MMYRTPTRESPKIAMLRVLGATMLALVLLLGVQSSASAQSVCASHAEVMKQLGSAYSEAQVAIGLASNGGVVEVFSTDDGSSWTIVMTMPTGRSCVVASGEAWEQTTKVALGPTA